jgi:aspartate aminotransferase-like enzyme
MFGPNTITKNSSKIEFCHRDKEYFKLHKSIKDFFSKTFNLSDYELVFIPGSGTVGIEALMFSLKKNINIIGVEGKFTNRWKKMANIYNHEECNDFENFFCQLETSQSLTFCNENCIVDAVSSFPYYEIPKNTKAFITSSNKIIGSIAGVSIVCIKNDFISDLKSYDEMSYLNLARYLKYSEKNQTPSTAPIQILDHLNNTLKNFNKNKLIDKINTNSKKLVNFFGEENIIGEYPCPVITISKSLIPITIAEKFQLYHFNDESDNYQIFTYSEVDNIYDIFLKSFSF